MAKFLYLSKKKEEKNKMKQVLSPAYLPNIEYCSWLLHQKKVLFSETMTYQKQSYRNRAEIYGANGKLKLIIPIKHRNGERKTLKKKYSFLMNKTGRFNTGNHYVIRIDLLLILNFMKEV